MKIRAVAFDLDNTIYDYDSAHKIAFDALTRYAGEKFHLSQEEFQAAHRAAMDEQLERAGRERAAIHNRLIRYQILLENLKKPYYLAYHMQNLYWGVFLRNMRPAPGVSIALKRLRRAGYTLGVGTNMTADYQYEKLTRLRIAHLFDFIVSSEEVQSEKPETKLFYYCLEKAGCSPFQCAFVGDSFRHDIKGALKADLIPIWYCPDFDLNNNNNLNPGENLNNNLNHNAPENASWADAERPAYIPNGVYLLRDFLDLPGLLETINENTSLENTSLEDIILE